MIKGNLTINYGGFTGNDMNSPFHVKKDFFFELLIHRYYENIQKISRLMKAETETPMNRTISMLEYLVKTDGAEHLKIGSRKLNVFYLYSIDVILLYMFFLVLSFYYLFMPFSKMMGNHLFKNDGNKTTIK